MKTINNPPRELWELLCQRPIIDRAGLEDIVADILRKVKSEGDKALFELTKKFDGAVISDLRVSGYEIEMAAKNIQEDLMKAIDTARGNIEKFHRAQLNDEPVIETSKGIKCWRKNVPIEKAGLYIPGGTAPLFSTVLMLAIPAQIAGCSKIILCTPPDKNGTVNPLILYAAFITGVTDIFKVGGAQAVAAMAFGTGKIPKVDKIFGPGNQYVTKAKEMVQLDGTAIDMPAGPSEVLIIADAEADPAFLASDLLSQAEHGSDSQVILLTDSQEIITSVQKEIDRQSAILSRKEIANNALQSSLCILFDSTVECLEFSNLYAPEHLIISTSDPSSLAIKVKNAGSVFLGKYSCESAGDYASGTNHTLPTGGYARSFSGVSVDSFIKKITFQQISPEGLRNIGPSIELMAEAENLTAHRNAVSIRLKSISNARSE
jgi:histidinol dehydrogenase